MTVSNIVFSPHLGLYSISLIKVDGFVIILLLFQIQHAYGFLKSICIHTTQVKTGWNSFA